MDAVSPAKPPSAKRFWLIWLSVTALAAGSILYLWRFGPLAAKATVFHQTDHGWERLPLTSSLAYRIQISDGGVAWVETVAGLTRYAGGSWYRFTAADLGLPARVGFQAAAGK